MILTLEDFPPNWTFYYFRVAKSLKGGFFFYTLDRPEINFGPVGLFSATACCEIIIRSAFDAPTPVDDVTYLQCAPKVCRSLSRDLQSHSTYIFWKALSQIMDLCGSKNITRLGKQGGLTCICDFWDDFFPKIRFLRNHAVRGVYKTIYRDLRGLLTRF